MSTKMHVKVLTPRSIAYEGEAESITAPTTSGEITILPRHIHLFSRMHEGILKLKNNGDEVLFSVGSGYVETDGSMAHILVSGAKGQDELDEAEILKAQKDAEKLHDESVTEEERKHAMQILRRSMFDMKLLRRVRKGR